jgi:SOS-response transcriptional repressor LexA
MFLLSTGAFGNSIDRSRFVNDGDTIILKRQTAAPPCNGELVAMRLKDPTNHATTPADFIAPMGMFCQTRESDLKQIRAKADEVEIQGKVLHC